MLELEHNGFFPLTKEHLDIYVPSRPGVFMLAVRLVDGVHKTFLTSQSDNLYRSLRKVAQGDWVHLPATARDHLEKFQCYFTYYIILQPEYRDEVEKMLTHSTDPALRLKIVNCN